MTPPDNQVIQLDVLQNSCITQNLNVKPGGSYSLEYDWAARDNIGFDSCKMNVLLDKQVIQSHTPSDYHVKNVKYTFNSANSSSMELSFCGQGKSDSFGAILDNVHVYKIG